MRPGSRGGPLSGLLVVELAETLAGEVAGGLLADMGATVIKVEPSAGSPMRGRGQRIPDERRSGGLVTPTAGDQGPAVTFQASTK